MKKIRVLIVDDHAVVRKGIQMILSTEPTIKIVGEAQDGEDAIYKVKSLNPDVVLMDLVMPHKDGIEAITEIKGNYPDTKVLVLTTFEDEEKIKAAMQADVDGYLLKDSEGEELPQAILAAGRGDMPLHPRVARYLFKGTKSINGADETELLTPREKEVLELVAHGLSNKDIAEALHLSAGTIKVHVSHILSKLNAASRTEAAVWAAQMGLISSSEIEGRREH